MSLPWAFLHSYLSAQLLTCHPCLLESFLHLGWWTYFQQPSWPRANGECTCNAGYLVTLSGQVLYRHRAETGYDHNVHTEHPDTVCPARLMLPRGASFHPICVCRAPTVFVQISIQENPRISMAAFILLAQSHYKAGTSRLKQMGWLHMHHTTCVQTFLSEKP